MSKAGDFVNHERQPHERVGSAGNTKHRNKALTCLFQGVGASDGSNQSLRPAWVYGG